MTDRPHGNTGNKHALKGDKPKDGHLNIRINKQVKKKAQADAKAAGVSLSDWIQMLIEA